MALIKCPECGGNVSDKAPACIHCGYPLQSQKELQTNQTITFQVVLIDAKKNDIVVVGKIAKYTGKNLAEARIMSENTPCIIAENITKEEADDIKLTFESIGAFAKVQTNGETYRHLTSVGRELPIICPKCRSKSVTTGQRGYSVFSGFWGSSKTVNRCGKCGHSWQPKK